MNSNDFWVKYRVVIVLALALAVMLFLIFMVAKPMLDIVASQTNEIQKRTAEQDARQQRIGEVGRLKEQYDYLSSQKDVLNVFVSRDSAVRAIEMIESIAHDTDNEITINIADDKSPTSFPRKKTDAPSGGDKKTILENLSKKDYILMDVKLSGDYQSIYNFLKKVETMKYLNDVTSVDIYTNEVRQSSQLPPSDGSMSGSIGAKIVIAFYLAGEDSK